MVLQPVIARLREQLSIARQVAGASGLDAALRGTLQAPAAFVIPLAEDATDMPTMAVTRQRITSLFGVVLVVDNLRGNTGEAGLDELEPLRAQLRAALVGWVPQSSSGEPVIFMSGELVQATGDGRIWWADEFQVNSYFRST